MEFARSLLLTALLQLLALCAFAVTPELSGEDIVTAKPFKFSPAASEKKGIVVIFLSAKCPASQGHVSEIKHLAKQFQDFQFLGVHSNADEPKEISKPYFERTAFPFPVIEDSGAQLANHLKAFKTPHAFLMDPDGKILYRGGVTNRSDPQKSDMKYLENALQEFSAGKKIKVPEGRTLGCVILREEEKNAW